MLTNFRYSKNYTNLHFPIFEVIRLILSTYHDTALHFNFTRYKLSQDVLDMSGVTGSFVFHHHKSKFDSLSRKLVPHNY